MRSVLLALVFGSAGCTLLSGFDRYTFGPGPVDGSSSSDAGVLDEPREPESDAAVVDDVDAGEPPREELLAPRPDRREVPRAPSCLGASAHGVTRITFLELVSGRPCDFAGLETYETHERWGQSNFDLDAATCAFTRERIWSMGLVPMGTSTWIFTDEGTYVGVSRAVGRFSYRQLVSAGSGVATTVCEGTWNVIWDDLEG